MRLFGLVNYEDYILKAIVNSGVAKNGLLVILTYIITSLVRMHISGILCYFIYWNNSFDLIFPVLVGILLSLGSDTIYKYVKTHEESYEIIVDYFLNNYSRDNLIKWKRIILILICGYIFIVLSLVNIDNHFILVTTVQTAVISLSCDMIENKLPQSLYILIYNWWHRPKIIRSHDEISMIDDYKKPIPPIINPLPKKQLPLIFSEEIPLGRISPPIPPKPITPPLITHRKY